MVTLVSFATTINDIGYPDTELRQLRLVPSAYKHLGIDQHINWNREKLKKEKFYNDNKSVLDLKPGAGYWLWKPYIIYDALMKSKDGDFVAYCDNSFYFVQDSTILLKLTEGNDGLGVFSYSSDFTLRQILQPSAVSKLKIRQDLLNHPVTNGGVLIFRKNTKSLEFVGTWLELCTDAELLMDQESSLPDGILHKHDMALLTYVAGIYKVSGFRLPYQSGDKSKIQDFRSQNDFLPDGNYNEQIFFNSPYGTLLTWDKQGFGCKRPVSHYFNPNRILSFFKRKI